MTFPRCDLCGHQFHGLPCPVLSGASNRQPAGPCGCVGAFDDDHWISGDNE